MWFAKICLFQQFCFDHVLYIFAFLLYFLIKLDIGLSIVMLLKQNFHLFIRYISVLFINLFFIFIIFFPMFALLFFFFFFF